MPLSDLLTQTATVVRRHPTGGIDRYGDPEYAEDEIEVDCEVQQRRRDEESDQELGSESWLGIFPAGTDLTGADAVIVDGLGEFELDGQPWNVWDPFAERFHSVEASLVLVRGEERLS